MPQTPKVIQARLIVGGNKYWPDLGSAIIAGFKDGWSHIDTVVPAGLDWAPEGWLFGARADTVSAAKCKDLVPPITYAPEAMLAVMRATQIGIPRGVQLRPPGYTTFRRCGILTIPVAEQQFADFWAAQHAKLGRPYDWRAIFAFLAPFGLRDWHQSDSWICSEAVEDSLEKAKILSPFWLAPNKISPGMVGARIEVLPGVWFTEIAQGTDPHYEAAIALRDWLFYCRVA